MEIRCPGCNHNLKAPERLKGGKGKCPSCGKIIDIPLLQKEDKTIENNNKNTKKINEEDLNDRDSAVSEENVANHNANHEINSRFINNIVIAAIVICIVVLIILAKICPGFGLVFSFVVASIIFVVVAKNAGEKDIGCMYFICIFAIIWLAVIIFFFIQSI